jgi:hypothetical protein
MKMLNVVKIMKGMKIMKVVKVGGVSSFINECAYSLRNGNIQSRLRDPGFWFRAAAASFSVSVFYWKVTIADR